MNNKAAQQSKACQCNITTMCDLNEHIRTATNILMGLSEPTPQMDVKEWKERAIADLETQWDTIAKLENENASLKDAIREARLWLAQDRNSKADSVLCQAEFDYTLALVKREQKKEGDN